MGRSRDTNHTQNLQIARLHFVDGLSYSAIADKFGLGTKNTVGNRIKEIKQEFPQFINHLQEIHSYVPPAKAVTQATTTEIETILEDNISLADKIEQQIHQLLDITPDQIQAMKAEHRLRHIPSLVNSMRLLREESTANVKQVSLIGCIGIATARRKPQSTDS